VIVIAKHALKFVDERPQSGTVSLTAADSTPRSPDATMMMSAAKQQNLASVAAKAARKRAVMHVVQGVVDHIEHELKGRTTYIGKSNQAHIKIKGTGWFSSAPDTAAMILHNADSYSLIPVQEGYVKLNGIPLKQKEVLKDGDYIQAGGTIMKFEERQGE